MSLPTDNSCPSLENPIFSSDRYQLYYHRYQEQFIITGLLSGLYGVLAILSMMSCYALHTKRSGRIQLTKVLLSLTILALFTSTTIYVVTCTLYYHADFMDAFIASPYSIWTSSIEWNLPQEYYLALDLADKYQWLQGCASGATLTVNVVLGDTIVCWRACTIWHKSRVVKSICGIFLLATTVLGAVDASQSCQPSARSYTLLDNSANAPGSLFQGIPIGIAACVLSLSTNVLATLLVAYKAWLSRRRLKGYFVAKIGGSQVEKLLALLVESGAIYSAIWSVVVAYQVGAYKYLNDLGLMSTFETGFVDTFGVIMDGTLVPIVAIYPVVIIVLVALNRSHVERGLTQHLESLPTPHIHVAIMANTIATTSHESCGYRSQDVLVIGTQASGRGEGEEDECRRRTSEEWKAEGIANAA